LSLRVYNSVLQITLPHFPEKKLTINTFHPFEANGGQLSNVCLKTPNTAKFFTNT